MNRLKLDGICVGEVKPKNTGKQCFSNAGKYQAREKLVTGVKRGEIYLFSVKCEHNY